MFDMLHVRLRFRSRNIGRRRLKERRHLPPAGMIRGQIQEGVIHGP